MKKIYISFMLIMVISSGMSQTWSRQTSGTTENLFGISFTDSLHGFACGSNGVVLKTINGGLTWTPVNVGTTNDLTCVATKVTGKGNETWVCGINGLIKHTSDGSVWNSQNSGTTEKLNSIIINPSQTNNTGYAVGDNSTILKTTNGGTDWNKITTFPLGSCYLTAIVANFSSNMVEVVGDQGVFYQSLDDGDTWQQIPIGISDYIQGLFGISDDLTFFSGTDGVVGKVEQNLITLYDIGTNNGIMGLTFVGANFGIGVGDNGYITGFDGNLWTPQFGAGNDHLMGVTSVSNGTDNIENFRVHTWAVGMNGTIESTVQNVVSGIPNNEKRNATVLISPNPVSGTCRIIGIRPDQSFTFKIYDLSGRLQLEIAGKGSSSLDLGNLSSGLYSAMISTSNAVYNQRVIIR